MEEERIKNLIYSQKHKLTGNKYTAGYYQQ